MVSAPLIHGCYWFGGHVLIGPLTGPSKASYRLSNLQSGTAQVLRPDASFVDAATEFGYMLPCSPCMIHTLRSSFYYSSETDELQLPEPETFNQTSLQP